MSEKKLFEHRVFKVNGVRFSIRKLSPSLFLDKEYSFPMTSVIEIENIISEETGKQKNDSIEEYKHKMKDAILISVVYVKSGFFSKKQKIDDYIDKIMEEPELYSYLFSIIVSHSFGQKKNYLHLFELKKISRDWLIS